MKKIRLLLTLLVAAGISAHAAPAATNAAPTARILLIDPSSTPVAGGKTVLTIGPLQRTNGVYSGEYKINVYPYFFKNQKGRLDIVVPDESLAAASQGKVVTVVGTATTSGKSGHSRHIDAIATPAGPDHGTLKLWFMVKNRKMTFEPAYHFAGKETAEVFATTTDTNLTTNLQPPPPVAPPAAPPAAAKHL